MSEQAFNDKELARYRRQLDLPGFGTAAQTALKKASVLMIGAGGLGCPVLQYLAAAGVGRLTVIDPDTVDVTNLQRQVLYTTDDLGRPKAEAAARRLRALNPHLGIAGLAQRFQRDNALSLVGAHDVVVDGTDNFATRYLANDACVLAGRPLVYGAVFGYEGQASVFNWRGGPTYRCLFPEAPPPGEVPACAEAGVLGVLPGLIGLVQATETLKLLTGLGEPLSGRLLLWDALSMTTRLLRFAAQPENRALHALPPEAPGEGCPAPLGAADDEVALETLGGDWDDFQWIDVREPWEQAAQPFPRAHTLPFSQLSSGAEPSLGATLEPLRPTLVFCSAGPRGARAVRLLRDRCGFASVKNLRGGYRSLAAALGKEKFL